jgi:transcriptional regulator of arginine metabolism
VREGAEHQLGAVEWSVLGGDERDVPSSDARGRPPLFVRRRERQREARMSGDERAELATGVSAGPEHSHGFHIHGECIIIHVGQVNPFFFFRLLMMAQKTERQAAILALIGANEVGSQEQLRQLLERGGVSVTQATLSRDLRELGVVRVPGESGARYALPGAVSGSAIPSLATLLPQLFASIDGVGELIVLKTLASGAQPVSEAIDGAGWREVLGTVAGENTILVICRSAQARQEVTLRLTDLARGG